MTIPAYRLPEYIERGSQFAPQWKNIIQESIAGNEQRIVQWAKCRCTGDVAYGLQNSTDPDGDFALILAMWRAHFGSYLPFRFRDWGDYQVLNEPFGTGNGTTRTFQLTKTYDPSLIKLGSPGTVIYVRNITLPNDDVVIEVNGVTQVPGTDYTTPLGGGLVTFATAPASGAALTFSGTFDVPVRFDTDQLAVVLNEGDQTSIRTLPIKEVIGES